MALGTWKNPYGAEGGGQPSTGDLRMFGGPPASTSSGSGFGGAFSKNFGSSFLDMWKSGAMGGGGSDDDDDKGGQAFSPGSVGGGSIAPIGDKGKHFLFQYTHPQAQIIQHGPDGPSFGEQLATTAIGAGISALCDIRTKVDIAPLESTEVNDSLAEIAFFVKGLRECA